MDLYYEAYEKRYQAVREVGDYVWGHTPDDNELIALLGEWTQKHSLTGKKVVEFACGEGAGGVVLSRLGCMYQGYDIAPSAIEKTRALLYLRNFCAPAPTASIWSGSRFPKTPLTPRWT